MSKEQETDIVVVENSMSLGAIPVAGPAEVIAQATQIATALSDIIEEKRLYKVIQGKKYIFVEGWSTLGAMLGVVPREVSCIALNDGSYEATVELVKVSDQAVIGRGSALCGIEEKSWKDRPDYARRSMAITRATGKAFRLSFAWIVTLGGYAGTPAEEMDFAQQSQPQHWIAVEKNRNAFWAYVNELELSNEEAHKALDCESVYDFPGTMADAKEALDIYADWKSSEGKK